MPSTRPAERQTVSLIISGKHKLATVIPVLARRLTYYQRAVWIRHRSSDVQLSRGHARKQYINRLCDCISLNYIMSMWSRAICSIPAAEEPLSPTSHRYWAQCQLPREMADTGINTNIFTARCHGLLDDSGKQVPAEFISFRLRSVTQS
jgi:hypothetical protein